MKMIHKMGNFTKLDSETLRLHKGKSFVGVVTGFICHDGKGRLYLTKRSQYARDEKGTWDYGGGGLKGGFTAEDNVKREVMEEFGCEAKSLHFLGYRDVFREIDGVPTHWLALDFAVRVDPAKATINEPDVID